MKKVLILIHKLQHYRIPILNLVSEHCQLTVACDNASDAQMSSVKFKVIDIQLEYTGPFVLHKVRSLQKLCNEYDHVIALLNIRCLDVFWLLFKKRTYALSLWGIGVAASYTKNFDQKSYVSEFRNYLARRADSLIFYTEYPVERFIKAGYPFDKVFIAHNTIDNNVDSVSKFRNKFVFVGTLYREKGVIDLVEQYKLAFDELNGDIYDLNIVGSGELLEELKETILDYGLSHKILLLGAIYDLSELNKILTTSVLSFSPTQAGLSVLQSMSAGVPFVTSRNAITGGEILNIQDGYNGILLNNSSEISRVMVDAVHDKKKYLVMGLNAYNYYKLNRTPEIMANGIIDCIKRGR